MKEFLYKKIIIYFVLFSPIIDIITSYMYYHGYNITIGLIIKIGILFLAFIYLVFLDKKKRKRNIWLIIGLVACLIMNVINSIDVIKVEMFSYFSYLFKYVYYIIMLLFFLRWYKEYNIKLSDLRIPILIIGITSIIAIITNTAYDSYMYNPYKVGYSMWYSSANELGNIMCLLFPVCIYNALHNKDGIRLDLYLIPVCGSILLLLGTKVGLIGYFLIVFCYLIMRLIIIKKMKLDLGFLIMLLLFIIPIFFGQRLPAVHNIIMSLNSNNSVLLSGREEFLKKIVAEREKVGIFPKIFGKSYYGELKGSNRIMLVEQDFIDVFFMYGYVGILIVVIPLIALFYKTFSKYLKLYRMKNKVSKKVLTTVSSISLCIVVSFISGHAILSPSVSLYLVLLISLLSNIELKNNENKEILVLASNKSINKISELKYHVEIIEEKSLYNRFIAYLKVKNRKYDYIVINDNDSISMQKYLTHHQGKIVNYKLFK